MYKLILISLFFLIGAQSATLDFHNFLEEDVDLWSGDSRVSNGHLAVDTQFPWYALITSFQGTIQTQFGGSLLSAEWVLTSGTAVLPNFDRFVILFGSVNRATPLITSNTVQRFLHPFYNVDPRGYNMGLIRLAPAIALSARVQPIRLASFSQRTNRYSNEIAVVAGFGATELTTAVSNALRWTTVRLLNNTECARFLPGPPNPVTLPASCLCTHGFMAAQGPCAGEVGSGVFIYDNQIATLVGATSEANCHTAASIYSFASEQLAWIAGVTGIAVRP